MYQITYTLNISMIKVICMQHKFISGNLIMHIFDGHIYGGRLGPEIFFVILTSFNSSGGFNLLPSH